MSSFLRCEYCGHLLKAGRTWRTTRCVPLLWKAVKATSESSPAASQANEQFAGASHASKLRHRGLL